MGVVLTIDEKVVDCFGDARAVWAVWRVRFLDAMEMSVQRDVTCT